MRFKWNVLPILAAAGLLNACGGAAPEAGDTAPIDDLRNRYVAAYNAGDAAGVAALFAEDAISMPDHRPPIEGRAAIQRDLEAAFAENSMSISITPGETEVMGDIAHEHGTFSVTVTPKAGGGSMSQSGKYLVVLKRGSDGTWLLHHDMDNASEEHAPPPAAAPAP